MSKIFAIYKKEVKGFICGPGFYLICFITTLFLGFSFLIFVSKFKETLATAMYQQGMPQQTFNIHYAVFLPLLAYLNLLMIVLVPGLTMRLLSEEKKMRSMDLLLTSPITSAQIVIGKYLAGLTAVGILCLIAFSFQAVMGLFADLNWGPLLVAVLGLFLVGAVYVAMDLFCSALTESAIISFFLAVMLNLGIWTIGMVVEVVDTGTVRQIFEHLSLNQHLVNLVEGTVRSSTLIFIGSLIFLFCFLAERVVESARWR